MRQIDMEDGAGMGGYPAKTTETEKSLQHNDAVSSHKPQDCLAYCRAVEAKVRREEASEWSAAVDYMAGSAVLDDVYGELERRRANPLLHAQLLAERRQGVKT